MDQPLDHDGVMRLLHNGGAVSAVRNGVHRFSFRMRPGTGSLPTLIKLLIGPRYEIAGQLNPGASKLTLSTLAEQADPSAPDVIKVHKLFNQFLLRETTPPEIDLVPAAVFERQRCFDFQAREPELYRHLANSDSKLAADCLARIRNYADITEAQRRFVATEMKADAMRKQFTDARQRRAARSAEARKDEDAIGDDELTEAGRKRAAERAEQHRKIIELRKTFNDDP